MSALTDSDAYWVLNGLPGIGPITLNQLLDRYGGDPVSALHSDSTSLRDVKGLTPKGRQSLLNWRMHFDLSREKERSAELGLTFVDRESSRYPDVLREIHDPPIGLYVLGEYDFSKTSVAIVGSRRTTLYGQGIAREFGKELAVRGFCVTSGMARGIDTLAHKGALEAPNGATVAVMGCGIDIIYPPENVALYREIGERGAVVSEFPLGRRADKQTFPMRNRLVSGMSRAVVIVESSETGGSLITARFAGEQGRLVCAIPGRIDQKSSKGCNQLIRDGAVLLSSVDDLLSELEYEKELPQLDIGDLSKRETDVEDLDDSERAVLKLFEGGESLDVDRVGRFLSRSTPEVSSLLMMLELKGYLAKRLDGSFESVSRYR